MENQRPDLGGFFSYDARSGCVDRMGQIGLTFGFIDGRVGTCVENHIRLGLAHGSADRVGIREIAGIPHKCHHLTERSQRSLELEAELAVGSRD